MTFCNSSLDVMDDNGDDDENSNNYDNEVDHDDCILCAWCRLVGGDAHMIISNVQYLTNHWVISKVTTFVGCPLSKTVLKLFPWWENMNYEGRHFKLEEK